MDSTEAGASGFEQLTDQSLVPMLGAFACHEPLVDCWVRVAHPQPCATKPLLVALPAAGECCVTAEHPEQSIPISDANVILIGLEWTKFMLRMIPTSINER